MDYLMEEVSKGLSTRHAQLIRAVFGENADAQKEMKNMTEKINKATEEFEQERHVMKMRFETMTNMEQHYTEEVNSLQSQLDSLKAKSNDQKLHEAEVAKLKVKIEELKSALEASQKSEQDCQEKLAAQALAFEEYKQEQEGVTEQKSLMMSDDYLQLQSQIATLLETNEEIQENLEDSEEMTKKLLTEKQALQSMVIEKGEELEQIRAEISSYSNALEKAREENLEVKVEMENLKLEKVNHGEKGNSLFGELDDRRLMAEKKLVFIQAQGKQATEQLQREKQQHHRLKVQMTTLLQTNSDYMDSERVSRMERLISQLRNEKETLLDQMKNQNKAQNQALSSFMEAQKDNNGIKQDDYTQFLSAIIESKEDEISKLKDEISRHNFKMLTKDDKLIENNRKIFKMEGDLEKAKRQARRLTLKLEEMTLQYEPAKENDKLKLGKTEKIPLSTDPSTDKFVLRESIEPAKENEVKLGKSEKIPLSTDPATEKFVLRESIQPLPNSTQCLNPSDRTHYTSAIGTGAACTTLYSTAISTPTPDESCAAGSGKQVKIRDSVEMISEDGVKEDGHVRDRTSAETEEFKASRRGRHGGIVHHNVKKVSSLPQNNFDKTQCKQQ